MSELMYPKPGKKKKKRKSHPKSILHSKDSGYCYLCGLLHDDYRTKQNREEHHVAFGNGMRQQSEQYGLKVYLCKEHHGTGPESPHGSAQARKLLMQKAQERFERIYSHEKWMHVFRKNYL